MMRGVTLTLSFIHHRILSVLQPKRGCPGIIDGKCTSFSNWSHLCVRCMQGTNGQSADSFRFAIRKQLTSHLCMRLPNKQCGKQATRRGYGATTHAEGDADSEFGFVTLVGDRLVPHPSACTRCISGLLSARSKVWRSKIQKIQFETPFCIAPRTNGTPFAPLQRTRIGSKPSTSAPLQRWGLS